MGTYRPKQLAAIVIAVPFFWIEAGAANAVPCTFATDADFVAADGAELSGEIVCQSFHVPAGHTVFIVGDLVIDAKDRIEVHGELRVRDAAAMPRTFSEISLEIPALSVEAINLATIRAGLPDLRLVPSLAAPNLELRAGSLLWLHGPTTGGRGASAVDWPDGMDLLVPGGQGSSILLHAPLIVVEAPVLAGVGGSAGRAGHGGHGGDVIVVGTALTRSHAEPHGVLAGGAGGASSAGVWALEGEDQVPLPGGNGGNGGSVESHPHPAVFAGDAGFTVDLAVLLESLPLAASSANGAAALDCGTAPGAVGLAGTSMTGATGSPGSQGAHGQSASQPNGAPGGTGGSGGNATGRTGGPGGAGQTCCSPPAAGSAGGQGGPGGNGTGGVGGVGGLGGNSFYDGTSWVGQGGNGGNGGPGGTGIGGDGGKGGTRGGGSIPGAGGPGGTPGNGTGGAGGGFGQGGVGNLNGLEGSTGGIGGASGGGHGAQGDLGSQCSSLFWGPK